MGPSGAPQNRAARGPSERAVLQRKHGAVCSATGGGGARKGSRIPPGANRRRIDALNLAPHPNQIPSLIPPCAPAHEVHPFGVPVHSIEVPVGARTGKRGGGCRSDREARGAPDPAGAEGVLTCRTDPPPGVDHGRCQAAQSLGFLNAAATQPCAGRAKGEPTPCACGLRKRQPRMT
jgi:hypothetical protein